MTPRRLLLPTTPDSDKRGSHRRKKVPRSAVRDGSTTGEGEQESNQKKRKRITPSPSPPPTVRFPDSNELDRLVPSITQSPLASSAVAVGQSPRRSPRLLDKVKAPSISNVLLSVKSKQKVLGFKLDNTTIHAWFRKDLELFSAANASSLKSKAQNNFQTNLQRKPNQVKADPGKSQRIAEQSQPEKPTKSKPTKSKGLPPVPPSIPSTTTIESNSFRRYLIEDFLFSNVGDPLLLQIALDHPHYASYSALYELSGPKPLRLISGRTFLQIPCVVTLHPRREELVNGMLDRLQFRHLLLENGNGSIGVSIQSANRDSSTEIFIFWKEVFTNPYTFEVWGHAPAKRSFRQLLKNGLSSSDTRQQVFNRLAAEVNNDRSLAFDACSAFANVSEAAARTAQAKANIILKKDTVFDAASSLTLDQPTISQLSDFCNDIIEKEITRCYGTFVSLTDPIIPASALDAMTDKLYDLAPAIASTIQKFLGYDAAMVRLRYRHMVTFYRRMTLFQVMALSRVRNSKNFAWWGAIGSAIAYGQKETDASKRMTTFFGHSLHTTTLLDKISGFMDADYLYGTAFPLIREQSVTYTKAAIDGNVQKCKAKLSIAVFDNSQMNFPFKFQRGEKTSNYVRTTSRLYIELWQGRWENEIQPDGKVQMTYCDQSIPSPFFMAPYELPVPSSKVMGSVNYPTIASADAGLTYPDIDFTGKRVEGYMNHLQMANEFICQQKYLSAVRPYAFQPAEYASPEQLAFRATITSTLSRNKATGKLYDNAYTFQQRAVLAIRGPRPKAKLLVLPVAKDDETTKKGIGATMLKLWNCSGLLSKANEAEFGCAWQAAPLEEERYIIKVGDGLSYERMRNYSDLIEDDTKSYIRHHAQVEELRKAMDRTMMAAGDLHARGFHALGPVYAVHHAGLIQPIQIALGWKRIEYSKVEKCYEQAAFLVLLILNECERQLYDAFLFQMDPPERAIILLLAEDEEAMAEHIGQAFPKWMELRLKESTDEDFKRILNFVKMARKYRFGRQSMRNGCAIAIEWAYLDFAGACLVLGKNICFEIALRQAEELYSKAPFWMLQTMRDNRFATLHNATDYNGRPVAHHALDHIIENLQAKLKQISLGRTVEAWMLHSTNVSLAQRCATFVRHNFGRRSDVDSFEKWAGGKAEELDIGRAKKGSTAPKRTATKQLICEILMLSKICVETPGRKADVNLLWNVLSDLTTELTDEEKKKGSKTMNSSDEDRELENLSAQIVDGELQAVADDEIEADAAEDNAVEEDNVDEVADDLGQAVARLGAEDVDLDDDGNLLDDEAQGEETELNRINNVVQAEIGIEEVVVGKKAKRKVKVKRLQLHRMATQDICEVGKAKMIAIDLPATRHRAKQRKQRERVALHDNLAAGLHDMGINFEVELARIDPQPANVQSARRQLAERIRNTTVM